MGRVAKAWALTGWVALACAPNDPAGEPLEPITGPSASEGGAGSDSTTGSSGSDAATEASTSNDGSATANPSVGASSSSAAGSEESGRATETGSDTNDDGGAIPSAACGAAAILPGEHPGLAVDHAGSPRSYDLFLPAAHDGSTPVPLVLNFHGWTQTAADHADFSQMTMTAATRGFALAYPQGIDTSWNAGICCGGAQSQGIDDVGFVRALVAELGATVCFDERRVYAVGHSNGGFLAHRLACEASDLFAAIGSIAGVLGIPAEQCNPGRTVPVMHMHGTADPIVAYEGGGALGQDSALASTAGWAVRNGCAAPPEVTEPYPDTTCQAWDCDPGAEVVLCSVEGMGHCWPGNPECTWAPSTTSFHASEMFADFFAEHALP